jgi:hypothetical protein
MRTRYTEEQFIKAVNNNQSIRGTLKELGLQPTGGNYDLLHRRIKKLRIDTSHWTGKGHLKGKKNTWHRITPLSEIMVEESSYTGSTKLKHRLLKEGIFEHKCYNCNLTEWLGNPIPIELEHKNGNSHDNRLQNLTLLCPNCHALTPTYRGKNMKRR